MRGWDSPSGCSRRHCWPPSRWAPPPGPSRGCSPTTGSSPVWKPKIGEALAAGTGVIIAVIPETSRLPLEQALGGSLLKSVAELDSKTVKGLESRSR